LRGEFKARVADWSRAGIGYTEWLRGEFKARVADWSRAGIGYTDCD